MSQKNSKYGHFLRSGIYRSSHPDVFYSCTKNASKVTGRQMCRNHALMKRQALRLILILKGTPIQLFCSEICAICQYFLFTEHHHVKSILESIAFYSKYSQILFDFMLFNFICFIIQLLRVISLFCFKKLGIFTAQKIGFPSRISSVNVTKSAVSCLLDRIFLCSVEGDGIRENGSNVRGHFSNRDVNTNLLIASMLNLCKLI